MRTILFAMIGLTLLQTTGSSAAPWNLATLTQQVGFSYGTLVADEEENLYGVSYAGGAYNKGSIYGLFANPNRTAGTYQLLYSFCPEAGCPDGAGPAGTLIVDTSGNLYGTTEGQDVEGNDYRGTAFELLRQRGGANWKLKVLHRFCAGGQQGCVDGSYAWGSLSYAGKREGLPYDGESPLFATTSAGGANAGGTVYELQPVEGTGKWQEERLYDFCSTGGATCSDGAEPIWGVTVDQNGNLVGTTQSGGAMPYGGTVFELSAAGGGAWTETILHAFCAEKNCPDGQLPSSGATMDSAGNIYGTTNQGGLGTNCQSSVGCGVLYEITFNAGQPTFTVLHNFGTKKDGAFPYGDLFIENSGTLYGTDTYGTEGLSVFWWRNSKLTELYSNSNFSAAKGVIADSHHNLFGNSAPVVFELAPPSK
jgi:hypothetical protein